MDDGIVFRNHFRGAKENDDVEFEDVVVIVIENGSTSRFPNQTKTNQTNTKANKIITCCYVGECTLTAKNDNENKAKDVNNTEEKSYEAEHICEYFPNQFEENTSDLIIIILEEGNCFQTTNNEFENMLIGSIWKNTKIKEEDITDNMDPNEWATREMTIHSIKFINEKYAYKENEEHVDVIIAT